MNKWQPKVDALLRLIASGSGATGAERDTAKRKLALILEHHPQAEQIRRYGPVFTLMDFIIMKREGISVDGEWTGASLKDAVEKMVADLIRRGKQRGEPMTGELLTKVTHPFKEWNQRLDRFRENAKRSMG